MTHHLPVLSIALLGFLALASCLRAQASGGLQRLTIDDSLKAMNFELIYKVKDNVPRFGPDVATLSTISTRLDDSSLNLTADVVREHKLVDEARRQPYRHFMPALNGATGLIDMPVAYTQPRKTFVVSVQTERMRADDTWWSLPYQKISQSNKYVTLNYGATRNIEVQADGEFWTKDFTYTDPVTFSDPHFSVENKFFYGLGSKWTFPFGSSAVERAWVGLGFRMQFFENFDRNVTEFHEYDRHSNVYLVMSTKATKELFGHFMYKYVSYDFKGGTFPSGFTDTFRGYSPTNAWSQWGVAAEWYIFPDLAVFTELLRDSSVVFLGNLNQFNMNAGVRYTYTNIGVGFWAKRINHSGVDDTGLQASVRF